MSSIFSNIAEGQPQQQPVQGNTPHHPFDPNQYQHMNQTPMQPGAYNNIRNPGMHPGMQQGQLPQQNVGMPPNQIPHQPPQQHQMQNQHMTNTPHNPNAANSQPPSQQMAPPASVQKLLDENNQYIQLLLDYQAKGKHQECAEYQRMLHRNLVYLATVADASNQNIQSSGVPPSIPLPPTTGAPQNMNGNPPA